MISSRNARTVANLAIASTLTILLAACSSMSLPSMSSNPGPDAEPGVAPEMPATIRSDEIVGRWGHDLDVLRAAALFDQARPWADKRPNY